jgi:hypothetical protein
MGPCILRYVTQELLETLCAEVDYQIFKENEYSTNKILNKHQIPKSDPDRNNLETFVNEYAALIQQYNSQKKKLNRPQDLDLNLGRIAWNSVFGSMLGGMLVKDAYAAAVGALAAFAITTYNEASSTNMNLTPVFWGALVGGTVGGIFDYNNTEMDIGTYVGAGIGTALVLADQFKKRSNKKPQLSLTEVSQNYNTQKENLIKLTAGIMNQ